MKSKIDLAKEWFKKAENDLKNAELIFQVSADSKPYDTVCFHCQQAVEKYLKSFLVFNDIEFPKTHNIEVLLDLASLKSEKFDISEAAILTSYAVEIRYPDDFIEINEEEAIEAYRLAQKIKTLVLDKVDFTKK